MSAILAIWNRDGRPADPAIVDAMLAASSHRAVDGQNVYIDGCVALAHQHFWLTPEEQGEVQPIIDKEAGLVITCDVRLDDRDTLENKLAVDKSKKLSDAQLILRAFKRWGEACVDHLLGDFAFAVWQPKEEKLFVARDALGARDLCNFERDSIFVAASDLRTVLAHPMVPRQINDTKIAEYLINRWSDQENSFYKQVYYWPPAHCAVIDARRRVMRCYWTLDTQRRIRHADERDYALEFREMLENSVRERMRTQGNIAVSLSGGPDSASLAAIVSNHRSHNDAVCISYVFDEYPDCDERQYIRPVTEQLGIESVLLKGDGAWPLRDLDAWPVFEDFAGQDPFVRLPLAVVDAASERGCNLIFDGHYSDILLAAGNFWAVDLLAEGRVFAFLHSLLNSPYKQYEIQRLLRHAASATVANHIKQLWHRGVPKMLAQHYELLDPGLVARTGLMEQINEPTLKASGPHSRKLRKDHLSITIQSQAPGAFRLLSNSKRVEYRDPFWDRRLIEYVMALPAYVVGRPPYRKYLLRRAMSGSVPESVLWRRGKTNLLSLFNKGFLDQERNSVLSLLNDSQVVKRGYVRSAWIKNQCSLLTAKDPQYHDWYPLWQVICVELWLHRYWAGGSGC